MKYIDNLKPNSGRPDEKSYKESIIAILCDYFCHEDITFILTNNPEVIPEYGNVIVFLSGNEPAITPKYYDKVQLVYTDFWCPIMPLNVKPIPLGTNERSVGKFLSRCGEVVPLTKRSIDVCFMGALYPGREAMKLSTMALDQSIVRLIEVYNRFFYDSTAIKDQTRYFKTLQDSKISLCPDGAGYETYRFMESMQAGNIIITPYNWLICTKSPNVFPIKNWNELTNEFVKDILAMDLDEIQKQSIEFYRQKISRHSIIDGIIKDIHGQN